MSEQKIDVIELTEGGSVKATAYVTKGHLEIDLSANYGRGKLSVALYGDHLKAFAEKMQSALKKALP